MHEIRPLWIRISITIYPDPHHDWSWSWNLLKAQSIYYEYGSYKYFVDPPFRIELAMSDSRIYNLQIQPLSWGSFPACYTYILTWSRWGSEPSQSPPSGQPAESRLPSEPRRATIVIINHYYFKSLTQLLFNYTDPNVIEGLLDLDPGGKKHVKLKNYCPTTGQSKNLTWYR